MRGSDGMNDVAEAGNMGGMVLVNV
jgi:hypothetical protein